MQLCGSSLLMICSVMLVLGGLHLNGLMWFLGTAGLVIQNVLEIYSGTVGSRFSLYNLDMGWWFCLSGWGAIFIGIIITFMVGMSPLPAGAYGCSAYCGRGQKVRASIKPRKRDEITEEDIDMDDE
jgi:hypothetical protein